MDNNAHASRKFNEKGDTMSEVLVNSNDTMQYQLFSRLTYIQLIGTYELNILRKKYFEYEIDKNCSNHVVFPIGFIVLYFHHHC